MNKCDYDTVYGCWILSIFGIFQLWDPITQKRVVAQQQKFCSIFLEWSKMICYKHFFISFTTRHKILPFGKKLPRSKIFTQFFFLVYTPLYQNLKSKLGDIHLHTPSLIQELDYKAIFYFIRHLPTQSSWLLIINLLFQTMEFSENFR